MPEKTVHITEAEWMVMEVLWKQSPLSAREAYDMLPETQRPDYRTIRTLLSRLCSKNAVSRKQIHGMLVFSAGIERRQALKSEAAAFLQRFFGGHLEAGFAYFIDNENISLDTVEKLKRLLDNKEKEIKK